MLKVSNVRARFIDMLARDCEGTIIIKESKMAGVFSQIGLLHYDNDRIGDPWGNRICDTGSDTICPVTKDFFPDIYHFFVLEHQQEGL